MSAPIFSPAEQQAALRQGSESHYRWLVLSSDPEAQNLRAAVEQGLHLAGRAGEGLRRGLMHERWGQHIGALAHLLTLGLLDARGFQLECEPLLGGQAPDILATLQTQRLLVEVRAITGAGEFPWRERRALGVEGRDAPQAAQRREALAETVTRILLKKADTYRDLCLRLGLPFVLCLYEDQDDQIAAVVERVTAELGLFQAEAERLAQLSAVLTLRRLDLESGALELRTRLFANPHAARPLDTSLRLALGP
ncbi:MAG: hypothetical protein ACT4PU_05800 [Planctomycetota bacterium]